MKRVTDHSLQLIAIYADDKKGLLGQILALFNRRDYPVHSLSVSRTDLLQVVLISLEVYLPNAEMSTILKKLEKLNEVHRAEVL